MQPEQAKKVKISLKWKADQFKTIFIKEYNGKLKKRGRIAEYRIYNDEPNVQYRVYNGCIYVFQINTDFYVGKTVNFARRMARHWYRCFRYYDKGYNYALYKAIRESGLDKFKIYEKIPVIHSRHELNNLEHLTYCKYKELYGKDHLLNRQEPKLKK